MGKSETTAIIQAIQKTTELLLQSGGIFRKKIIDKTADYAFISELESGYSAEIDDIVDNIPDDPPPTPENQTMFSVMDSTGEYSAIPFDDSNNEIMEPYTP